MRTTHLIAQCLIATALLAAPLVTAYAEDSAAKTALKASFDTRAAQLAAAKASGSIGETTKGLVAVVDASKADAAVTGLVAAENDDRTKLYALLAGETGSTAEQVAEQNARRNFQQAKSGEQLQTKDGRWIPKK